MEPTTDSQTATVEAPAKARRPPPRYTPAQMAIARHLPAAIAGGWSARDLAREAGVGFETARDALLAANMQIRAKAQQALGADAQKLVVEARKARERALGRLESLGKAVDKVAARLESDDDADARDVASAVKAAAELHRHVEQLTGQDVAKAIAIKSSAETGGRVLTWDGVAAIDVSPVAVVSVPNNG